MVWTPITLAILTLPTSIVPSPVSRSRHPDFLRGYKQQPVTCKILYRSVANPSGEQALLSGLLERYACSMTTSLL